MFEWLVVPSHTLNPPLVQLEKQQKRSSYMVKDIWEDIEYTPSHWILLLHYTALLKISF